MDIAFYIAPKAMYKAKPSIKNTNKLIDDVTITFLFFLTIPIISAIIETDIKKNIIPILNSYSSRLSYNKIQVCPYSII